MPSAIPAKGIYQYLTIFYVEMIFFLLSTGNLRVYYLFRMWSGMFRQAKPYLDPPGLFSSPSVGTGR